jgi:hypothetical protein
MRHYVFAGRYGDICHSLPAVWEYAQRTGDRPRFTAAAEFAGILDGCSYLEPHGAPVQWEKIQEVIRWAKGQWPDDDYVVMACYGHDYSPGYQCHSYLRDSWRLSQCPRPPETVPLVFDLRSPEREAELIRRHTPADKPFIAVSTQGKSSPFHHTAQLLADIRTACPDLPIVDVGAIRGEKVFDVLGLMESATALVTIDTLHLHLSAALPTLPVFALVCDGPTLWNRSDWRPQQVWRASYSEFINLRPQFRHALASSRLVN